MPQMGWLERLDQAEGACAGGATARTGWRMRRARADDARRRVWVASRVSDARAAAHVYDDDGDGDGDDDGGCGGDSDRAPPQVVATLRVERGAHDCRLAVYTRTHDVGGADGGAWRRAPPLERADEPCVRVAALLYRRLRRMQERPASSSDVWLEVGGDCDSDVGQK